MPTFFKSNTLRCRHQSTLQITHQPLKKALLTSTVPYNPQTTSHIMRLGFRSDTRLPSEIFKHGFHPQYVMDSHFFIHLQKDLEKIHELTEDQVQEIAVPFIEKYASQRCCENLYLEFIEAIKKKTLKKFLNYLFDNNSGLPKRKDYDDSKALIIANDFLREHDTKGIIEPFESHAVVAVSKRLRASSMFPYPANTSPVTDASFIYICYIKKGIDVHMQGLSLHLRNQHQDNTSELMNVENIQSHVAEEIITDKIPPSDIIAAIPLERDIRFSNDEHENIQGHYRLGEPIYNFRCMLDDRVIKTALDFIKREVKANHQQQERAKASTSEDACSLPLQKPI